LLVDVLCAALSGAAYADLVYPKTSDGKPLPSKIGHFFGAWRVDAFRPVEEFKAAMDDLQRRLKNAPKSEGQNRIYIHGEKEFEEAERRLRDGIPLNPKVAADLRASTLKHRRSNILFDQRDPDQWAKIEPMVGETFSVALELGGTLSGEHGVGTLTR